MRITYCIIEFSGVTGVDERGGHITTAWCWTSGLIIIHARQGFGVTTNFCCRYISPRNTLIPSSQTIWVSNALLRMNVAILSPRGAEPQGTALLLPIPHHTKSTGQRKRGGLQLGYKASLGQQVDLGKIVTAGGMVSDKEP